MTRTVSRDISLSVEEVARRIAAIGADRRRVWWKDILSIGPDVAVGAVKKNNRFEIWYGIPGPAGFLSWPWWRSQATIKGYVEPGPSGCHLFGVVRSSGLTQGQAQRLRDLLVEALDLTMAGTVTRREDSE